MASQAIYLMLLLFTVTMISSHFMITSTATKSGDDDYYLNAACNVTSYRALCVRSLAGFSRAASAPGSPRLWARAAVSVTLAESERVGGYLAATLRRRGGGWARGALADCVECFGDAVAELHRALGELRRLRRSRFEWQMSNVETWVSAALTSQDTCLDGFAGYEGEVVGVIRSKVLNATYFSSNALALVNRLASSGGD